MACPTSFQCLEALGCQQTPARTPNTYTNGLDNANNLEKRLDDLRQRLRQGDLGLSREDTIQILLLADSLIRQIANLHQRVEIISDIQKDLDRRLLAVENSFFFRTLRGIGTSVHDWKLRLGQALLHSRFHSLYLKFFRPSTVDPNYQVWLERESASLPSKESLQAKAAAFERQPLISVLMPVHNPQQTWLEAVVASVVCQTYPHWQLCIFDDASTNTWVQDFLASQTRKDSRILYLRSEIPVGISEALNRAGELASGEYLGFLDHDDALAPSALYYVVEALQEGNYDMIYTDEDRMDSQWRRTAPIFRPDWSPDLLDCCMYMGHFLTVRRDAWGRIGRFRSAFDGAQDYDLALRIRDSGGSVRHIPRVLYHWRMHEKSTSADPQAKPRTHEAGRRALEDSLARRRINAVIEDGNSANQYRVRRRLSRYAVASIIVCSRTAKLLDRCLQGIAKTTMYPNYEIVVVEHRTVDATAGKMDVLFASGRYTRVPYTGPFNFSKMNNQGVSAARGEMLIFLNDDIIPITPAWLGDLVAHLQRPEIGVVGAKLLFPSGVVQHAGIAIGIIDTTGHPFRRTFGSRYWHWLDCERNVTAVTGACFGIRKEVFEALGGFEPEFAINYNDVDLCLRARAAGYEVIIEPSVVLRHDECRTRLPGGHVEEKMIFRERWSVLLKRGDPFYNRNLTHIKEDAGLDI